MISCPRINNLLSNGNQGLTFVYNIFLKRELTFSFLKSYDIRAVAINLRTDKERVVKSKEWYAFQPAFLVGINHIKGKNIAIATRNSKINNKVYWSTMVNPVERSVLALLTLFLLVSLNTEILDVLYNHLYNLFHYWKL